MLFPVLQKPVSAPAFFVAALLLAGPVYAQQAAPAGVAGFADPKPTSAASAPEAPAFTVEIGAPQEVQDYLRRHLELMRYRDLADLDNSELERLVLAAEDNVRELLATLGYFSPVISMRLRVEAGTTPAPAARAALRVVSLGVETGPPTRVGEVVLDFSAGDQSLRDAIRAGWTLQLGTRFTQAAWDGDKARALQTLAARRYPLARIGSSSADVDAEKASVRLQLQLDPGPAYRLGRLRIEGLTHFDSAMVERLARLMPGEDYDQTRLQEAQQRLQDSGYFESVYLAIDASGDPGAAPVVVTLREAKQNKLVLGLGASTDSGPRVSVEHTRHQLPGIGWRAASKLMLDRNLQSVGSELTGTPDEDNWRWLVGLQLKQENAASVDVGSQSLRVGRTQAGERRDRNYFLQYEHADTSAAGAATRAQSLSANYGWTQRSFDSLPFPASGYGLGVEVAGGWTLGAHNAPFARTQLRWLGVWSLGDTTDRLAASRAGRIALRAQAGALWARSNASLPATQLFLTGGDTSVRGYVFHGIGATSAGGQVLPGRYLGNGSAEWQRPILVDGAASDWEGTLFVDVGAVADKPSALRAQVGLGTGARWKSPVGPLQADLAYGLALKRLRLHLTAGFNF